MKNKCKTNLIATLLSPNIFMGIIMILLCNSAFAFVIRNIAVPHPDHHNIVSLALFAYKGIPASLREELMTAAERPDYIGYSSPDQDHFLYEPWSKCSQAIVDRINGACTNLAAGDLNNTKHELGIAFHTAADFYAHSNWVEGLWNVPLKENELTPPEWWECDWSKGVYVTGGTNWTIEGIDLNNPAATPPDWWRNEKCTFSKDTPDKARVPEDHEEAFQDAILQTQRQWDKFQEKLFEFYPNQATNLLKNLNVIPDVSYKRIPPSEILIGSKLKLNWYACAINPSTNINISLLKDGVIFGDIAEVPLGDRFYNWTVGTYIGGVAKPENYSCYQLQFTPIEKPEFQWTSEVFMIFGNSDINLSKPNGGESWVCSSTYAIRWTSTNVANVKIELIKGTVVNAIIKTSTPASTGSYNWTIPATQANGSDYKIRITDSANPYIIDSSDTNFFIKGGIPDKPVLLSPGDNATVCTTTPTFKWNAVTATPAVDYYQIQINYNNAKFYATKDGEITGTNYTMPANILKSGTTYAWYVRAHNAVGWSSWSGRTLNISVFSVPAKPILNSPANNATVYTTTPTFKWDEIASVPCPARDYYQVQINYNGSAIYVSENVASTSKTVPSGKLQFGKTYAWYVRAHNSMGWSAWSGRTIIVEKIAKPPIPPKPTR